MRTDSAMIRVLLLTLAVVAVSSASARDFFVKPSLNETFGSGNYVGSSVAVDFGSQLHVKPSFSSYHSNTSGGTYDTYGLRGGYEFGTYSLGLSGAWSPRVNGYSNRSVGGDFVASYDFDDKTHGADRFISSIEVGAGLTQIMHREAFFEPAAKIGTFNIPASTGTSDIGETDLNGNISVVMPRAVAGLNLTKSIYNKDLSSISARQAQVTRVPGLNSVLQGFPSLSLALRVDFRHLPVTPYLSYTYTQFKVAQSVAVAYTLGVDAKISALSLNASYQRSVQKGAADRSYFSLGSGFKFR